MFTPDNRSELSDWSTQMRVFNSQMSKGSRQLTKVTWYVNPEGADRPGVYAALDFVGNFPSAHLYCGYIMLYRLGLAKYEIVREEQSHFVRNAETPDPDQLTAIREATCRK